MLLLQKKTRTSLLELYVCGLLLVLLNPKFRFWWSWFCKTKRLYYIDLQYFVRLHFFFFRTVILTSLFSVRMIYVVFYFRVLEYMDRLEEHWSINFNVRFFMAVCILFNRSVLQPTVVPTEPHTIHIKSIFSLEQR